MRWKITQPDGLSATSLLAAIRPISISRSMLLLYYMYTSTNHSPSKQYITKTKPCYVLSIPSPFPLTQGKHLSFYTSTHPSHYNRQTAKLNPQPHKDISAGHGRSDSSITRPMQPLCCHTFCPACVHAVCLFGMKRATSELFGCLSINV